MNLLTDRPFTCDPVGQLSLPGLMGASARGEVQSFRRLRPHQRAAWHMFRVQLAALALRAGGLSEPPEDEEAWRELLRALTPELGDDPWNLEVEDRNRPAFLQPPDPGGLTWSPIPTPDALDLLITARNHDVKAAVADEATPEDWAYALISLQTSEGYGGRNNFGVARMNGGSSSRPMLSLAPAGPGGVPDPSSWWRRDLQVLLRNQNSPTVLTRGGPALLWCQLWPEGGQLGAQDLDPWFIEVCRRVRLVRRDGRLGAERAGSKAARVEAKAFAGALDDAWAPVNIAGDKRKALTLSEGHFDYRRIVALLFAGDWTQPIAADPKTSEEMGEAAGDMVLVAEALSRGNSKTDGLKTRIVPMPRHVLGFFKTDAGRLSTAAHAQIDEIKGADAALREAVALYAAAGDPAKVGKPQRQRASAARARLDAFADRVFFEHLWDRAAAMAADEEDETQARRRFRDTLRDAARREFRLAISMIPCPTIRAPRAEVRAIRRLEGLLRHHRLIEEAEHV